MASLKLALPVLDGYGAGDVFVVADPSTKWGLRAAEVLGGVYLGGSLQAAHDACETGKLTTVLIGPGTYTLTSALAITKANIKFKAVVVNETNPTVIITSSLADTVQVDANNISFEGIEFKAGADACTNLIDVADVAAVAGLEIRNCVFNPDGKATVRAINAADATFAMSKSLIENNKFLIGFDGAAINIGVRGMGNSVIKNNLFQITAAKVAIALADTTAFATGYGYQIIENDFIGADATGDEVAISVAGTEDTTGTGIIRGNNTSYCAAASFTQDKFDKSVVFNYTGSAGNGGALIDPSA